jgi:hypothetical protein
VATVAETVATSRSSGFDSLCVAHVAVTRIADILPTMTLAELEAIIRKAWCRDTSDDPDDWKESDSARGQCGVTAMVIHELFGGVLLVSDVSRDGARVETHYWNRLASGIEVDFTREQFRRGEKFGEPRVIDPDTSRAPKPDSLRRVRLLSSRVHEALGNEAMHLSPS